MAAIASAWGATGGKRSAKLFALGSQFDKTPWASSVYNDQVPRIKYRLFLAQKRSTGSKYVIDLRNISVSSPKRTRQRPSDWDAFFPYYAGYPASFAHTLLSSLDLPKSTRILDPWNGSGTTTYVAGRKCCESIGIDINPVMILVARARSLAPSEADSLLPLAFDALQKAKVRPVSVSSDPLENWFDYTTACHIRSVEQALRTLLIGKSVKPNHKGRFDRISGVAATLYVALFSICRKAGRSFRTSNPTWVKRAYSEEQKLHFSKAYIERDFIDTVRAMADALEHTSSCQGEIANARIYLGDSSDKITEDNSIDFVLTSPPYCTRIDYTSATSIELSVLSPLLTDSIEELGKRMIGSTRVPRREIDIKSRWGPTCLKFIEEVGLHKSKASAGYYRKTHLDYFDKIDRSLRSISNAMRDGSGAAFVVQDSYYKDIHNDLAKIFVEMGKYNGLRFCRRDDFRLSVTLAASHPHATKYAKPKGATESVLCFQKG